MVHFVWFANENWFIFTWLNEGQIKIKKELGEWGVEEVMGSAVQIH